MEIKEIDELTHDNEIRTVLESFPRSFIRSKKNFFFVFSLGKLS